MPPPPYLQTQPPFRNKKDEGKQLLLPHTAEPKMSSVFNLFIWIVSIMLMAFSA